MCNWTYPKPPEGMTGNFNTTGSAVAVKDTTTPC